MTMSDSRTGERVFTGRHMLIVMICFFGTIIAVNVVMAVFASSSWTGLVVKNSYVASQHYNAVLDEAGAQRSLGWRAGLSYEKGELVFSLVDKQGQPVRVADTRVLVGRPTHEGEDRTLDLAPEGDAYVVRTVLAPGIWNAEVKARRPDGQDYRIEFRLVAKSRG